MFCLQLLFWRRELFEKTLENLLAKHLKKFFQTYQQLLKSIRAIPFGVERVDLMDTPGGSESDPLVNGE